MALIQKLSEDEIALYEILNDPIWFAEFLRNTRDGVMQKQLWPKRKFSYRWYQKDLLTDRSKYVAIRGGRAVGKCQPTSARVLTPSGWKTLRQIVQEYERRRVIVPARPVPFDIVAVTKDMQLKVAPALILYNGRRQIYKVETAHGYEIEVTKEHPLLTRHGYVATKDLKVGDEIAVMISHPDGVTHERSFAKIEEMRLLGYCFFEYSPKIVGLYPRNKHILEDIERISDSFHAETYVRKDGAVALLRGKHYYWLLSDLARRMGKSQSSFSFCFDANKNYYAPRTKMPAELLSESKNQFRAFVEAVFAQYADISRTKIEMTVYTRENVDIFRRILLRFGVFFRVVHTNDNDYTIIIDHPTALYNFFTRFSIPGVAISSIVKPADYISTWYMYDRIVSITEQPSALTYAVQVFDHHVYLSEYIVSHNSLFLEDRILLDIFQHDSRLRETKEVLLLANNEAQIEPLLQKIVDRLRASPILSQYVKSISKNDGVIDFRFPGGEQVILRVRATGQGNNRLVGLHVGKVYVDEAQLFSEESWQQAAPTLNDWEADAQVVVAGVPNGARNTLLYLASKPSSLFKEYHIPAPNNPFYSADQDELNKKRYGGEQSDAYQQLVLGNHGQAVQVLLQREQITTVSLDYTPGVYTEKQQKAGEMFYDVIPTPKINYQTIAFGIDCGFIDPTVIMLLGKHESERWYVAHKVMLKRIDFDTQVKIIDWLAQHYRPSFVAIDASSGGGGMHIVHTLQNNDSYDRKYYQQVLVPVQFHSKMVVGYNTAGEEVQEYVKSVGASQLVQMIADGTIVFPEIDLELISELERITRAVNRSGQSSYFILSETGHGASNHDHQFAALICFAVAAKQSEVRKTARRLALPRSLYMPYRRGGL